MTQTELEDRVFAQLGQVEGVKLTITKGASDTLVAQKIAKHGGDVDSACREFDAKIGILSESMAERLAP